MRTKVILNMRSEILSILLFAFVVCSAQNDEDDKNLCESKCCEEDPNYPENILNTLSLWKYDFDDPPKTKRSVNLESFLVETKLCESKINLMRPQKLKNTDGKLRTIVNHSNYTQFVRFETCSSENFPCTFNVYPKSVKSFCQQKQSSVKLLAFDEDRNRLVTEKFPIPMTCDCLIDKGDFLKGVNRDLIEES